MCSSRGWGSSQTSPQSGSPQCFNCQTPGAEKRRSRNCPYSTEPVVPHNMQFGREIVLSCPVCDSNVHVVEARLFMEFELPHYATHSSSYLSASCRIRQSAYGRNAVPQHKARCITCHRAACLPAAQPRTRTIVTSGTAQQPETDRSCSHLAARTRGNFLSFAEHRDSRCVRARLDQRVSQLRSVKAAEFRRTSRGCAGVLRSEMPPASPRFPSALTTRTAGSLPMMSSIEPSFDPL